MADPAKLNNVRAELNSLRAEWAKWSIDVSLSESIAGRVHTVGGVVTPAQGARRDSAAPTVVSRSAPGYRLRARRPGTK